MEIAGPQRMDHHGPQRTGDWHGPGRLAVPGDGAPLSHQPDPAELYLRNRRAAGRNGEAELELLRAQNEGGLYRRSGQTPRPPPGGRRNRIADGRRGTPGAVRLSSRLRVVGRSNT